MSWQAFPIYRRCALPGDRLEHAALASEPRRIFWSLDERHRPLRAGANAILAVSLAVAKAGAAEKGVPLYKHIADLAGNTKLACLPPHPGAQSLDTRLTVFSPVLDGVFCQRLCRFKNRYCRV